MLTRENEAEIDEILLEMWNQHTADATIKETRLGLQRLHAAIKPGQVRMLDAAYCATPAWPPLSC